MLEAGIFAHEYGAFTMKLGQSKGFIALMERVTFGRIPEVDAPLPIIQVPNTQGLFTMYASMLTLAIIVLIVERWFSMVKKQIPGSKVARTHKPAIEVSVKRRGVKNRDRPLSAKEQQQSRINRAGKSAPAKRNRH